MVHKEEKNIASWKKEKKGIERNWQNGDKSSLKKRKYKKKQAIILFGESKN